MNQLKKNDNNCCEVYAANKQLRCIQCKQWIQMYVVSVWVKYIYKLKKKNKKRS